MVKINTNISLNFKKDVAINSQDIYKKIINQMYKNINQCYVHVIKHHESPSSDLDHDDYIIFTNDPVKYYLEEIESFRKTYARWNIKLFDQEIIENYQKRYNTYSDSGTYKQDLDFDNLKCAFSENYIGYQYDDDDNDGYEIYRSIRFYNLSKQQKKEIYIYTQKIKEDIHKFINKLD